MLYKGDGRRKEFNASSFTAQDWFMGVRAGTDRFTSKRLFNDLTAVFMRLNTQVGILESVQRRFETSLFDIRQLLQADLVDSELESARELHRNGFLRASGVIAGVVLDAHLSQVCESHGCKTRKKNPAIANYNDLLKNNGVVDVPQWRSMQRLGDIRNLCGHKKEREPTDAEVLELIEGVDKVAKTLY